MAKIGRNPVNRLMTYEEVNALSTNEIIHKLQKFGIPFKQETFLKDVEKFYSAEELSENWFDQYTVTAKGRDEDFPWLAAWILWERLAPSGKQSMEQMDNLIDRGYEYVDENDATSACDIWLTVWEAIKDRINPEYQNLDYLDKHYKGSFFIRNFCQDLEGELHNAGVNKPAYFKKRINYCREFCHFFPKESEIIHNMRRAIAESYAELGQYEKADSEFEKLVQDFPDNPWGYIGWGDLYFFGQKKDVHKAREVYEKGLTIARDQTAIEAIKERLDELKEER
ncbi:M48 family metallopeptidase [Sporolactobacillus sp. THM19-2]|uniref:tetratricopeptide repeat protein n=1 Tax=Sporolactobacillus sp. THM19-2 TaxID=2511171 RepID=UPI00101FA279|nr:tetratricopeptide repeat protein [Sporolactobacillus sp. THM19-2]RYL87075.1 tetratricopeptide repeat protein [Sporolactobacillus sp. THM19-2]